MEQSQWIRNKYNARATSLAQDAFFTIPISQSKVRSNIA